MYRRSVCNHNTLHKGCSSGIKRVAQLLAAPRSSHVRLRGRVRRTVMAATDSKRVLSIQSHVVHGYVGNKCAIFPLQLLGFDVDPVMTVQFSNHTGYPVVRGTKMEPPQLAALVEGMRDNDLLGHTHLLTGYIGSGPMVAAIAEVAGALREANPRLVYVCDPVLGDEGALYVPPDVPAAVRTSLLPLTTLLTPNQYEAELLTGRSIGSIGDALAACEDLHAAGPSTVIITSAHFDEPQQPPQQHQQPDSSQPPAATEAPLIHQQAEQQQQTGQQQQQGNVDQQQQQQQQQEEALPPRTITLVASTRQPQGPGCPAAFRLDIPALPGYFTGTGDLLAALLLAYSERHPAALVTAVESAVGALQGVLATTAAAAGPAAVGCKERSAAAFRCKELRLVSSQHHLVDPQVVLRATPLTPGSLGWQCTCTIHSSRRSASV